MEIKYYQLRPEIPGGLGEGTRVDNSVFPPKINDLHFVFSGWMGDSLIACFPCYLVTVHVLNAIKERNFTGFSAMDVKVSYSENFMIRYPDREMPSFKQLLVDGKKGDDFFVNEKLYLVVSNRALEVIEDFGTLEHCEIVEED